MHESLADPKHGITQKCHLQREKRIFNSGSKTKLYKIFTNSLQHNAYLSVHKYQRDSSFAKQIFLLNPGFLSINCIQLLFFPLVHSNVLENSKNFFFRLPQRKRSQGAKSGDIGGHSVLLCRLKSLSPKIWFGSAQTGNNLWKGDPSWTHHKRWNQFS